MLTHSQTIAATGTELGLFYWEQWYYDRALLPAWNFWQGDSCNQHCDDHLAMFCMGQEL